jgi:hypothetical protein
LFSPSRRRWPSNLSTAGSIAQVSTKVNGGLPEYEFNLDPKPGRILELAARCGRIVALFW